MQTKKELNPKLGRLKCGKVFVYLWYKNQRFRYSNGSVINQEIFPNHHEQPRREQEVQLLLSAFKLAVRNEWKPAVLKREKQEVTLVKDVAQRVLNRKLSLDYSQSYKKDLIRTKRLWDGYIKQKKVSNQTVHSIDTDFVADFIYQSASTPQSKRNLKRNISALIKDELETDGVIINLRRIKLPTKGQELHRPIQNIQSLLNEVRAFNENLYLCCLITYCMLLRPHREIRCLRFSDFNEECTILSLDGSRVKSKRNRILPVPEIVRAELIKRKQLSDNHNANLFSLTSHNHHNDYFKGIWTKFKASSEILSKNQTLYSFRHTGAIKVFEKTGSLLKLQQVMGHSDMKVSLTYLRGLEVKQLNVEDLPEL
jgi:integrase